jgi:hypothetical protein
MKMRQVLVGVVVAAALVLSGYRATAAPPIFLNNMVWLMDGAAAYIGYPPAVADLGWEQKGLGDFNGDGRADILFQHKITGQVIVWFMAADGTSVESSAVVDPAGWDMTQWYIGGIGDINGDGKADVSWRHK